MTWRTTRNGMAGMDGGSTWFADGGKRKGAGAEPGAPMAEGPLVDAAAAAEQLLGSTRRTTALTLEAALSRVRPLRRDKQDRFYGLDDESLDEDDLLAAAFDMMTLSRLSLRSAERLNEVVATMIGGRPPFADEGMPGAGH